MKANWGSSVITHLYRISVIKLASYTIKSENEITCCWLNRYEKNVWDIVNLLFHIHVFHLFVLRATYICVQDMHRMLSICSMCFFFRSSKVIDVESNPTDTVLLYPVWRREVSKLFQVFDLFRIPFCPRLTGFQTRLFSKLLEKRIVPCPYSPSLSV